LQQHSQPHQKQQQQQQQQQHWTYREKSKIGRKPTAIRTKVKIIRTKATITKVAQSGDELIARAGSVDGQHMKKIAKPSTRASIRSASARALIRSASDHMQDPEQEQDLAEKKAKAAMHKSERKNT